MVSVARVAVRWSHDFDVSELPRITWHRFFTMARAITTASAVTATRCCEILTGYSFWPGRAVETTRRLSGCPAPVSLPTNFLRWISSPQKRPGLPATSRRSWATAAVSGLGCRRVAGPQARRSPTSTARISATTSLISARSHQDSTVAVSTCLRHYGSGFMQFVPAPPDGLDRNG
jgi:hypothetical protein